MHANARHTEGQVDSCRKLLLLFLQLFFSSPCTFYSSRAPSVGDARRLEVFLRCFVATIMRIIMHNCSCVYDNTGKRARRKRSSRRRVRGEESGMREALSRLGPEKHTGICIWEGLTFNLNGCDSILVFNRRQRVPTMLFYFLYLTTNV